MTEVREFANHWGHGTGTTWSNRAKEELIEVGKGDLFIPVFRPFDLLDAPNKPLDYPKLTNRRGSVSRRC